MSTYRFVPVVEFVPYCSLTKFPEETNVLTENQNILCENYA